MSTRSWLLRNMVLPAGDMVFRQRLMKRLRFLEEAQWWDPQRTAAWRDDALRNLVAVCYSQAPLYRELMDKAGVKPADIRTIADLPLLPVVTKPMMRDAYPAGVVRETGFPTYETRTSGSTGKLFTIREDSETAGIYRGSFMLWLAWAGWRLGDEHMMSGGNFDRSLDRRIKDSLFRCHYVRMDELTDARLDQHLDLLERRRIENLWGFPGLLYYVARRAESRGWTRPLKSIVTWGEMLYPSQRELIERVFGTPVRDTYGCGEGFQIAAQCPDHGNYHIHELEVAAEFVDDAGKPLPPGTPGHVTITRFHPGAMPFLRYQPGDLASASAKKCCPCGRSWGMLESIAGRATDTVITPSGNRIIGHIFNKAIMSPEIDSFQAIQKDRSSLTLRLLLLPGHTYTQALEHKLIANLHRYGVDLDIRIEPVSELPMPPSGKHRFVISQVAPN